MFKSIAAFSILLALALPATATCPDPCKELVRWHVFVPHAVASPSQGVEIVNYEYWSKGDRLGMRVRNGDMIEVARGLNIAIVAKSKLKHSTQQVQIDLVLSPEKPPEITAVRGAPISPGSLTSFVPDVRSDEQPVHAKLVYRLDLVP